MKKRNDAPSVAFALGLGILSFVFFVVILTAVAFIFHGAVSLIWLILALAGAIAITYWKLVKDKIVNSYIWIALLLAIFIGSIAVSSKTLDSTWDGNDYHKTAIGEMRDGWNPVWEPVRDFQNSPRNPLYTQGEKGFKNNFLTNWTDHYPKASWIFAANIYMLTGNIESGKATTLLSMIALFCFAFSFFYKYFGRHKSIIIALLLSLNPIVVAQIFSFYNDGLQGNLLMILILLLTMLVSKQADQVKQRWLLLSLIVITITLTANLKFSGLAYAAIIAFCYYAFLVYRKDWKLVKQLTIAGILSVFLSVVVVGSSSYVVNTLRNNNPVFPLAGEGKIDIMTDKQPVSFINQPGLQKFVTNNFYATSNYDMFATEEPQFKIPFTVTKKELKAFEGGVDVRQAGYGVWFGGILAVSVIISIYLAFKYARGHKDKLVLTVLPLITIAVTVLAFDNTWWARYLPQLILFPIIVVIILFALRIKVLPYLIAFALFVNTSLIGISEIRAQVQFNRDSRASMNNIKCNPKTPATIGYGMFYGAVYNIRDICSNIEVTHEEVPQTHVDKIVPLYVQTYQLVQ